jgi:hypothetical protein
MDIAFRASGADQEYEGRAILTRDNAWVEFRGETYQVGEERWARARKALRAQADQPETLQEAGVDPMDWLDDLETEGNEEVDGTPTTKVSARVDVERMLSDLDKLSGGPQEPLPFDVGDFVDDVGFEAWIGEDDIWRRVSAQAEFRVPDGERDSAGGVEGGHVSLDLQLDDPNEPVEIEGPPDARPLDELLRRLGIPPELLLGPGFAAPALG